MLTANKTRALVLALAAVLAAPHAFAAQRRTGVRADDREARRLGRAVAHER